MKKTLKRNQEQAGEAGKKINKIKTLHKPCSEGLNAHYTPAKKKYWIYKLEVEPEESCYPKSLSSDDYDSVPIFVCQFSFFWFEGDAIGKVTWSPKLIKFLT